jgi:lipopolysaccharide transport system permease protein
VEETFVRLIRPARAWPRLPLAELWKYRGLIYFLAWRDVKVRYKQTALGVAWAIIQPLSAMVIFWIFLGRLAGIPSDGIPYPIFVFTALVAWQLFSFALTESSGSVVANERLVTKVYFPRLAIPIAAVLAGLVDFTIALLLLILMMAVMGIVPTFQIVFSPLFALLAVFAALAVGCWLSALNVRYRDVRHTLSFVSQIWLFATPVAYPASLVPDQWRLVYSLNPMVTVVEGFRWSLLGGPSPSLGMILVSSVSILVLLTSGLVFFQRMEQSFADFL